MRGHELGRGAGEESARREGHFVLDDAGHGDCPDLPLLHGRRPPFGVVGDTYHATDGETVAPRRSLARVSSVLRAAVRPRHEGRHGHERGVRLHVDAHEGAHRREARLHRGRVRRARRQHVPLRPRLRVQGRPQGNSRPLRLAAAADPRSARGARDPAAASEGCRGRRCDRHARDARGRTGHRRRRRHRRPGLVPARARTRTSRSSTTSAAYPTTPSTTKPASRSAIWVSRPRSTRTTQHCAATRATTFRAFPASARRRPRS